MLSLIPLLGKRLEFASIPCIAFSFWALLVLVQISLQGSVIRPLVLGVMLLGSLLLLGFVSAGRWKSLGTPGVLILAAIAPYLVIGSAVPLFTDAELQVRDVLRQAFFFIVTLAAMLGGRSLLERIGVEELLKWTLVVLTASCIVILATPLLNDIGVLPEYRLPSRLTSTFSDPNDAGFIACMTASLALALLYNGRQRWLGRTALVLGYAAAFLSFSHTAMIVMGMIPTLFLLLNIRRLRQELLHTGLSVLGVAGVLVYFAINLHVIVLSPQPVLNIGEAAVREADEAKLVDHTIEVYMVNDQPHRADDIPVNPWQWQRANAQSGYSYTPDNATWTDIDDDGTSSEYTPTAGDEGKFFRAYVDYDKDGHTYRAQTVAIGPMIMSSTGALSASAAQPVEEANEAVASIRGESRTGSAGGLSRRTELWAMGFEKVLESPIAGHGLYQLHSMEGAPVGHHGQPVGVHNLYLVLLGEAGIIPLALYVLALFFLIRVLWTMPISLTRDSIVGWIIVMALFGLTFQHLLTMGAYTFLIGLTCAMSAFLVQGQREPNPA